MRLHYIYIAIGLLTAILNGMLTFHILHKGKGSKRDKSVLGDQDAMVFFLSGKRRSSEEATVTELNDDTVLMGK
jgi:hypothetical protein